MATSIKQRRAKRSSASAAAPATIGERLRSAADRVTHVVGTPWAMIAAAALIVGWAASGPIFGFSDTWQLVINTTTTIVTFLMVFAIQTSQNREAKAVQLKLDELITTEQETEEMLEARQREFERDAENGRRTKRPRSAGRSSRG